MRNVRRQFAALATCGGLALALYCTQAKRADHVHRPSALPDRIILSWSGDPATTQSVSWRTDTSVRRAYAQVALAVDGPGFDDGAVQIVGETTPIVSDLGQYNCHSATFKDLKPNTLYVYRLGDGENWSAWNYFRTAAAEPEPFRFVYFGDAQKDIRAHWSRVVRTAYSVAPDARFFLHAGDLVNRQGRDSDWGEWHRAAGWVNAVRPSVAVPGNHEYAHGVGRTVDKLSMYWRPQFAFPQNGPAGLEETVYWFDYQGVRIIALNSNERIDDQAVWLDDLLSSNPQRWTIVTHHHPIYAASQGMGNNTHLRDAWQTLYDKHGVDLVLQGHDHSYGRTGLRRFENSPSSAGTIRRAGTVYVVSVSGPKMRPRNQSAFAGSAEGIQLFQVISIEGDFLRYEARTATGRLHDAFTLRQQPGEANELIEELPPDQRTASRGTHWD